MSKERWLIGLVSVAVLLGTLLFASVLVTDRRREAAVGELKAKGRAVLDQRVGPRALPRGQDQSLMRPGDERHVKKRPVHRPRKIRLRPVPG